MEVQLLESGGGGGAFIPEILQQVPFFGGSGGGTRSWSAGPSKYKWWICETLVEAVEHAVAMDQEATGGSGGNGAGSGIVIIRYKFQ